MVGGSRTAARVAGALAAVAATLVPAAFAGAATQVSPGTRVHVTVTLKPRDPAALAAYARLVSTPGSSVYRRYLTPAQFASRFGATAAQVRAVRDSLGARGLTPGPTSSGSLSIPVIATAAQLQRAFSISLRELSLPGRRTAVAASAVAAFDAGGAGAVQSVLGLDTASEAHPLLLRPSLSPSAPAIARPRVVTGGPQPCAQALTAASGQSAYTADQIASAYGFSGLYGAGDQGAGVTIAIYELEPDAPSDIAAYQACYGTHATVSYIPVDGGVGTGPGSGEAALDIENAIGLAPAANVLVYQGPNTGSGAPGSGPYDTFSVIINQDRANVISTSWGECEAMLGQADAIAENTLFQQAAAQGESIVAASGDSGSEDCDAGGALPQTQLGVDDPASQPDVTGVGGTSLQALGPRPSETVWSSDAGPIGPLVEPGAGGGGVSSFWSMPASQLDAGAAVGVRSAAAGSGCSLPGGYCREVPDVSADADPSTGYVIYWNGAGSVAGQPSGWQGIGGTSAGAPLWAALLALVDASPACGGAPVGYANPALYRAATSSYANDFNDVTTGDNDYTDTNDGRYAATRGYDLATGLGTPNAAALTADLCADTVKLANPGPQRSTAHAGISVRVRGSDAAGVALTYRASGLPPGLVLGASSGQITGKPRQAGTFTVAISARDSDGSNAVQAFNWTIGDAPRISHVSLTTTTLGTPVLTFVLAAGRDAPPIQTLQVTVPHGLRLVSRGGVSVTAAGAGARRLRFADHAVRSTLTIRLRSAATGLRVRLTAPGLAAAAGRVPNAARSGQRTLRLSLSVVDATAGTSRLVAKVQAG
jgi:subtilase family serine protease